MIARTLRQRFTVASDGTLFRIARLRTSSARTTTARSRYGARRLARCSAGRGVEANDQTRLLSRLNTASRGGPTTLGAGCGFLKHTATGAQSPA